MKRTLVGFVVCLALGCASRSAKVTFPDGTVFEGRAESLLRDVQFDDLVVDKKGNDASLKLSKFQSTETKALDLAIEALKHVPSGAGVVVP